MSIRSWVLSLMLEWFGAKSADWLALGAGYLKAHQSDWIDELEQAVRYIVPGTLWDDRAWKIAQALVDVALQWAIEHKTNPVQASVGEGMQRLSDAATIRGLV